MGTCSDGSSCSSTQTPSGAMTYAFGIPSAPMNSGPTSIPASRQRRTKSAVSRTLKPKWSSTEPCIGPVGSRSVNAMRKFGRRMEVSGPFSTTSPPNHSTHNFLWTSTSDTFRCTCP